MGVRKELFIAACTLACLVLLTDALTAAQNAASKGNLAFVGNVDGKLYYAQGTPLMNWTEAASLCESERMKLATVTSRSQWTVLDDAYSFDFNTQYWTAGRDSHELRQFSWNESGTEVNQGTLKGWLNVPYQTCLAYNSVSYESYFYYQECSAYLGALCETFLK